MSTTIGFATAIITILGLGSYLVPMKRVKDYDPFYFQVLMCITAFVFSVIFSLVRGTFVFSALAFLSGFLWAGGNILSVLAVGRTGLARAAPIWMGGVIIVSFLWGMLFFREELSSIPASIIGIIALIAGIVLVSSTIGGEKASSFKGIVLALAAGAVFGSYLVPFKLSGLEPASFLFPMSLGILAGGLIISLIKRPKIDFKIILPGALSGLIWNIANFASFYTVLILGMSVGYPQTQRALFVSVLWGLLCFHEIEGRQKIIRLVAGGVILFIGAILLGLSM